MVRKLLGTLLLAFAGGVLAIGAPVLAGTVGMAVDGQIGMMPAASPVAEEINKFYDMVNWIIIAITLFVMALLVYVMIRFNEKNNPTPSTTTHNTALEVAWTVLPILVLVLIAVPSFKLLFLQYSYPKPDVVIKATASQWYWSYGYPDNGDFEFDALMLDDDERKERIDAGIPAPRNLATDNEVVVPVGKVVHVLITATDVLHNWTVPSFGSKIDAVPGRTTATWFKATKEGVFYGQCSELCGKDHAFMPIAVRVVKSDVFTAWAAAMEAEDEDKAAEIIKNAALEQASGRAKVAANSQ